MLHFTLACKTCAEAMAAENDNATGYAILFMLAVILPTATAIMVFFIRLARRSTQTLEPEFQDSFESTAH